MFNISGFLEKFKKFDQNKTLQTESILVIIEKVVGFKVEKKDIAIKNNVLYILGSPAMRQEVFLRKENLLSFIKTEGIFDIR